MKGLLIDAVARGSIGDELEVKPGDRLYAVNGHVLRDIIDYSYHVSMDDELLFEIVKPDGEIWEMNIQREPGESLGLTFSPPIPSRCRNNCVFCFVHQLPKGLRKPLYIKDEDYRLSFLNGNYVTLANLTRPELLRIKSQRLSPLYISVHSTNPELRQQLLGAKNIPPILEQMQALSLAGIRMHTQVVLCPGLNDGKELERTVSDLTTLYPAVQSLAIVPLGLTRHRSGLPKLTPVEADYARDFIGSWLPRSRNIRKQLGEPFLFIADEFFLKAGIPLPPLREYGDLPQIENGVGMVPLFVRDAKRVISSARPVGDYSVTVVTGHSSFGFVSEFLEKLGEKTGVRIIPVAVDNQLFGESVTVSGLISGMDIIAALCGRNIGTALMVPDVMLKEGENIFLDDVTMEGLAKKLGCPVISFEPTPQGFYRALKRAPSNCADNQ